MTRKLVILVAALAAVVGLSACDAPHRAYCFGEGGHIDECVSPGSRGTRG